MPSLKKLCFLLLVISAAFTTSAQTVADVLARYVAFTGGEKQWKTIRSIVSSGTYNYGGMEFPFTTYSKAPDRYKVVVPFKGKYFAQAFDGKTGWKIDAFKNETTKTILTGSEAKALLNEADVELEPPFINYLQKGHQATLDGRDTVDGTPCFKIQFTRKEGAVETYFFNAATYALMKKQAVSKNPELDSARLDIYYSDYRLVKGLKLPFKTVTKSNGQPILKIIVRKVVLNTPMPDAAFKP